jgi:5-methyltetrahydropteroyltriglutamate--homocysteine methyltransferase
MSLRLSHSGSYPRIGDSADLQTLRRAIAARDRAEASPEDLRAAENDMTRRAIADQVHAGLDVVTDGQIRWYDPISYLAGKLGGVEIRGLLRFFDTNFYFRQPVLAKSLVRNSPLLVDDFLFARDALGHLPRARGASPSVVVKPVLTGPYTLAKFSLSQNGAMSALESRAMAYATVLAAEVLDLAVAGATLIQVDEPAIIKYPADWPLFTQALAALTDAAAKARAAGRTLQLALHVYFHDCAPLFERLAALPVDILGLDFTYNPGLVELIVSAGSPLPLSLGLVDGRNTKLENPATLARAVERMLPKISGGAFLAPSSGLEYLPRDRAKAKLDLLQQVRAALFGASEVKS